MKFALATLYVTDLEKSLHFYNELLEIPILGRQAVGGGKEIVFLGIEGEPNLELITTSEAIAYAGFSIGFAVDDLPALKQKLNDSGYAIKREMATGGPTLCFLDGPNGEEVELIG